MTTLRRAVTVVVAAAGLAAFGGAASVQAAHAQTADEQFEQVVGSLGITAGPETDLPALGQSVCTTMTRELGRNPNPPPLVRSIVSSLENSNLTRAQAIGFMQASVAVYCPMYTRFTGR
jgi:hypothetical protein